MRHIPSIEHVTYLGSLGTACSSCATITCRTLESQREIICRIQRYQNRSFPSFFGLCVKLKRGYLPNHSYVHFHANQTKKGFVRRLVLKQRPSLRTTTSYSCHSVFKDRSIFSLNLPRIQTPAGASVTNQKHGFNF